MGIKCGRKLTEDCIGDTDPRYDPDALPTLNDQADVWQKMDGLYAGSFYWYGADNLPQQTISFPILGEMKTFPNLAFHNYSTIDTRFYFHSYEIYESAIQGGSGFVRFADTPGHSTHEKDGSIVTLQTAFQEGGSTRGDDVPLSRAYPVGNTTSFGIAYENVNGTIWEYQNSRTCLDDACDNLSSTFEFFVGGQRVSLFTGSQTRVNAEEWAAGINQAYDDRNVVNPSAVPMTTECLVLPCTMEEEFCESGDPSCSDSPYQEPDGKVKPGVIAGFTIAGFVLMAALLYYVHTIMLKKQKKRIRSKFSARIAETIDVKKSMKSLSPDLLMKEFKKIDADSNGNVSKEELWTFLSTGKAGDISEKDFNVLWAAIDADHSGSVDYLEFCAYMSLCHDEYNAAPAGRGNMVRAISTRMSLANKGIQEIQKEAEEEQNDQEA